MQIKFFLFPVYIVISLAQGCSFSHSSESSSDSSGSSSDSSAGSSTSSGSSSTSSASSKDPEQYQLLIISYTSVYLSTAEFDRFAFSRGISEIATANGITNWEDDETTLIAIGRGLKNANISDSLYEMYKKSVTNANAHRMQMIQKGYDMH